MEQMQQKFIIKGSLDGRNEAEAAARTHWSKGANLKKVNTETVMWEAISQHIKPVKAAAAISVEFFEGSLKRDADNVTSAIKYILDGLVAAKVLVNDTRKYVSLTILPVQLDREHPRIEITIRSDGNTI